MIHIDPLLIKIIYIFFNYKKSYLINMNNSIFDNVVKSSL